MRSDVLKKGAHRAAARAMPKGAGYTDAGLERPLVGFANRWTEVTPCDVHLSGDLAARAASAPPRPARSVSGVLAKHAALVSSASEGAVTRPPPGSRGGQRHG